MESSHINKDTNIHGDQNNYFNGQPTKALSPTRDNPCISPASLSPLGTYIDRPAISAEIGSKMQKPCGSKTLAHALALIGLGGTGKTQLVLRYIEQHEKRYDTVLWLDVRDKATTMSSFERCCSALSIELDERPMEGLLHDVLVVQKLLEWLTAREQVQKWLVVFDNAEELKDLTRIIPHNIHAGSVIIISQDRQAANLLRKSERIEVDKMEIEESKALLAESIMDKDILEISSDVKSCLERLANRLDGIALALDLAGARIRDDTENRHGCDIDADRTVTYAIDRYFADLEQHRKSMLSDTEHNAASDYQKTIWSVWTTVLNSLERCGQRDADIRVCPMEFLKLAVILGPSIVHEEVFRAASSSLEEVCTRLEVDVPLWFKSLLQVFDTGVRDSFAYRDNSWRSNVQCGASASTIML